MTERKPAEIWTAEKAAVKEAVVRPKKGSQQSRKPGMDRKMK